MKRSTIRALARPAAAAVTGLAIAVTATACSSTSQPAASARRTTATPASEQYAYYRTMMGSYRGGMMSGGYSWMMSAAGYRRMTGTGRVPGWMLGGRLPGYMMGTGADPGKIMGRFWAGAPGLRISQAGAARAGSQAPAGARANRTARTMAFTTATVRLTVSASPTGGPDETFRIAGIVKPHRDRPGRRARQDPGHQCRC